MSPRAQGEMTRAGKRYRISNPRRSGPEAAGRLPRWAAPMMRAFDMKDFIEFEAHPARGLALPPKLSE